MKVYVRVGNNALHPVGDVAEEFFAKLKWGMDMLVTISRPRNLAHHRKFFTMVHKVFQNQEVYRSEDDLLDALKIAIGHVKRIIVKGVEHVIPKSISFAKMDQDEFDDFYKRAVDFVRTDVIPGLGVAELENELAGF